MSNSKITGSPNTPENKHSTKASVPFGCWPSPITAEHVGGKSPKISEPCIKGNQIFWIQSIPEEKSRNTIMMYDGEQRHSLIPAPINVKSKVHEYGGGAYAVFEQTLFFVVADDQGIYKIDLTSAPGTPVALTASDGLKRFADLHVDPVHKRLLAVCEDHSQAGSEATTSIVSVALESSYPCAVKTLVNGDDFYSNPVVSPDGKKLCWIAWNHPNMPWDKTTLYCAALDNNGNIISTSSTNSNDESVCQPRWSPNGALYVISDRNNWWNIYRCDFSDDDVNLSAVLEQDVEFATPPWTFNMSTYGFLNEQEIIASYTEKAEWKLCRINLESGSVSSLGTNEPELSLLYGLSAEGGRSVFIGSSPTQNEQLYFCEENTFSVISSVQEPIDPDFISKPQAITFPTSNNELAHGFYYPPTNKYASANGALPPAIIICHGGPTGSTSTGLNLKIQYWTSRGFAVFDVNYRGSTGYGKKYRESLYGEWGVKDVDDVCAAADSLVENKLADHRKLIIKGSSAGGYTVLAALAFRDSFSAGVSLYGIGDLEILARDTHKFEARYMDNLVGAYPEEKALYQQRSPIHAVNNINCPLMVFQGLEDKVVPPNQAQMMVDAVKEKGIPVAYTSFPEEGHGFQNIQNIKHMLEDELYFYCKIFSLPVPEDCNSSLKIENFHNAKH